MEITANVCQNNPQAEEDIVRRIFFFIYIVFNWGLDPAFFFLLLASQYHSLNLTVINCFISQIYQKNNNLVQGQSLKMQKYLL